VDLECQQEASKQDGMLLSAAKTVFASSNSFNPSFWIVAAMLAPPPLLPSIRFLASIFPGKALSQLLQAFDTLYDVSASLIQVSQLLRLQLLAACMFSKRFDLKHCHDSAWSASIDPVLSFQYTLSPSCQLC